MKRIVLIALTAITFGGFGFGQNTFPSTGNVGVGTSSPSELLEVRGNIKLFESTGKGNNSIKFYQYNDKKPSFIQGYPGEYTTRQGLQFGTSVVDEAMTLNWNGYLGISNSLPSYLLELGNESSSAKLFKVNGKWSDVEFNGIHTEGNIWSFINTGSGPGTRMYIEDANNSSDRLTFDFRGNRSSVKIIAGTSIGNVGIGTTSPDEKLTVKGKIHAEEVRVDLSVPADYVFEKYYTGQSKLKADYQMPSLEEVEAFTKANNHLPSIPSAKEIQEEGLHLKQMTNLLLQKVEELTLYTIEQEKRIKKLENQLKQ